MEVKGIVLARAVGCERTFISKEVNRGNLIKNEKGLVDLDNQINKSWCALRGISCKDGKLIKVKSEKIKRGPKTNKTSLKKKPIKKVEPKKKSTKSKTLKKEEKKKNKVEESPVIEKIIDPYENNPQIEEIEIEETEKIFTEDDDFATLAGLPAKMLNMTIKQLMIKHGGKMQLKGYADILDKLFSAQKKETQIQAQRLELIARDFVSNHLFSYVEILSNQILNYPSTIVDIIIAQVVSDKKSAQQKIPEMMRKDLSRLIAETKKSLNIKLKELKNNKEDEDD
ncbi:MAG: hypothetical protein ACW98X_26850 [Promethearchaeota archaeon]|jgi:hypothetical protein